MRNLVLIFSIMSLFNVTGKVHVEAAEYWWCKSCGLAYPASQKVCLNKDCVLFRKPK